MRRVLFLLAVVALVGLAWQAQAQQEAAPQFKDKREKVSYIVGMNVGHMLKNQDLDLDMTVVMRGVQDALNGVKPNMTPEDIQQTLQTFEAERAQKMQERAQKMQSSAQTNMEEGQAFLENNKKNPDVVTLPSGLQYKVLKRGEGPSPTATDRVTVRYKGTYINGKVFDSTAEGGDPVSFRVDGVIPGWQEALPLMKVGGKWELYVPSTLAYGPQGFEPIGPNTTLIFQVELLAINPPQ
ncbi:MAG TPA: FKBP-type peptidyl-prolyl cis-trans isomerase [Pirellulales bacterium]